MQTISGTHKVYSPFVSYYYMCYTTTAYICTLDPHFIVWTLCLTLSVCSSQIYSYKQLPQ